MEKNIIRNLAAWLVAAAGMASCGVSTPTGDLVRDAKRFPVVVSLSDGTTVRGEARLPNVGTRDVTIRDSLGSKREIDSKDIASLTAWNKKAPDAKHVFVYYDKLWMAIVEVGDHLMVFARSTDYYIDKGGTLTVKGGHITYFAAKPGDTEPTLLFKGAPTKQKRINFWAEYLADDPALCEKMRGKEIDPDDFEAICAEYNPAANN